MRIARKRGITFLGVLLGLPMGAFVAAVFLNAFIDPFNLVHNTGIYAFANEYQRSTNAGRIRTSGPFDAAVVGSSYVGNFDPALIEGVFGTKTKVFSIFGASSRETTLTLSYLLKKRTALKLVFFEASIWNVCNDAWHPAWEFPIRLYDDNPIGVAENLFSIDTIRLSIKELHYRYGIQNSGFTDSETLVHRWYETQAWAFNNPDQIKRVLARDLPTIPEATTLSESQIEADASVILACMKKILPITAQHPDTTFFIFNPPVLQYLLWFRARIGLIEVWNRAQERFAAEISTTPNVRYFDFYAATEIGDDCRRFMDTAHFDPAASDQIVRWMKSGTFERTKASNPAISDAVRSAIRDRVACPPYEER
jgi:hypothetical protein